MQSPEPPEPGFELFSQPSSVSIQPLQDAALVASGLTVFVVRADQCHPHVSGNKWYKLKYNLLRAKALGCQRVLSFGGAYSNHIHALAYAARQLGMSSVGIIRGEPVTNSTLADAHAWGMTLDFVSRQTYRQRTDSQYVQGLMAEHQADVHVPEGGSNVLALQGVGELMQSIQAQLPELDYLLCAVGTGGTLAGLAAYAPSALILEGYPVLKGAAGLYQEIQSLLSAGGYQAQCPWQLDLDAHYGGYGKVTAEHLSAWQALEGRFGIPLDPIYTAKLLRRFLEKAQAGSYSPGSRIALLHSGGLQGRRSLAENA